MTEASTSACKRNVPWQVYTTESTIKTITADANNHNNYHDDSVTTHNLASLDGYENTEFQVEYIKLQIYSILGTIPTIKTPTTTPPAPVPDIFNYFAIAMLLASVGK